MHVLTVRIPEVVRPGRFDQTHSINNKRISVPFSDSRFPQPFRIRVFWKLPPIRPDFAQNSCPLEELQHPVFGLDEFERPSKKQNSGITQRIALSRGIVPLDW